MITFLQPQYLWGLLALLIPILIHLIFYFRPKTIPFSHLRFLKAIYKTSQRRFRLKQWLVLLSRMGIFAFLTLMLARPVWKEERSAFHALSSVLILLDDSPSMGRGVVEGGLFHMAQNVAEKIIRSYSPSNRFLVLPLSQLHLTKPFTGQKEALYQLQNLHVSAQVGPPIQTILKRLAHFQSHSPYPLHVYLISDYQKSQFQLDSLSRDSLQLPYQLHLVRVGGDEMAENKGILDVQIQDQIIEPFRPIQFQVKVLNHTSKELAPFSLRVFQNNQQRSVATGTVPQNATETIPLSFTPEGMGWITGFIETEPDLFPLDDRFYFAFFLKQKPKVLVVYQEHLPKEVKLYFSRVISEAFASEFLSWNELTPEHIHQADVLFLLGEGEWNPALLGEVKQWLNQGHGIVYFPSKTLVPETSLPVLLQLGIWKEEVNLGSSPLKLEKPDMTNPIVKELFEKSDEMTTFESPLFFRYYRYQNTLNYPLFPLFRFQNGDLATGHYPIGSGHFFLFLFPLDSSSSDYLYHPLFVALTYRLLSWSANPVPKTISYDPSTQPYLAIPYPSREQNLRIRPVGQDSISYIPEQSRANDQTLLFLSRLHLKPGIYEIVNPQDSILAYCAINLNSKESYFDFASSDELRNVFSSAQIHEAKAMGVETPVLFASSDTMPLWKWCLLLAIICFFGEMILLRWFV